MTDKHNDVVTTSITNLDIHDLARSAFTFGLHSYWVVHPVPAQRRFAERILQHWLEGWGATYNVNRKEALSVVHLAAHLGEVPTRSKWNMVALRHVSSPQRPSGIRTRCPSPNCAAVSTPSRMSPIALFLAQDGACIRW
jgi:hypothetical protein